MKVTFYQRKPHPNHFSIEKVFQGVREHLPNDIDANVAISRFSSLGLLKRIYNIFEATTKQGDINHITGDVHFLTILLKKKKTILTIHDCGFMDHPSFVAKQILLWFWLKLPVWHSQVVTVISEATKCEVLKHTNCASEKVKVIPDFVSPAFQPAPYPKNNKPILLQIGTKTNKNISRLAEAIKGLEIHLRIVGKPSVEDEEIFNSYKIDFSWDSHLSEERLIHEYVKSDVLVFVSTLEGFGMPIVEAQAVGRPVITSNISSMPEVAGEGAFLADPFDIASIREGVCKVIADQSYRENLIQKGFENVKKYQVKAIAQRYADLYQEIYQGYAK
ncbi:glycosyltransferase involved in cell wall biosynthesis [Catalinimonas alkaloidigena]|uniref:glycosyltransferase family 4 protein n=1 Tax=Catalinimonas alkaloidigena TaxID=1075417 RepID=UPI002407510A|nr:glycosyltransferase family 1 protein [Catalinimonas alkaloidigena]MDF9798344.1 glycosyltransferase involved in cell wall biosynthesis [Catalinimonas alkaloidigena]